MIEELRKKPQLIAEGVSFFRECAEKDSVMPAVRAVCLRNFRVWALRGNLSSNINVPEYVSNIANSLPAE